MFDIWNYFLGILFLMLYLLSFLPRRYSLPKTSFFCMVTIVLDTLAYAWKIICSDGFGGINIGITVMQILLIQGTVFLVSRNRDARDLFIGLSASNYVMAGGIAGGVAFVYTGNMEKSLFIAFAVHLGLLLLLILRIRRTYQLVLQQTNKGWLRLCLIPAMFYGTFCIIVYLPVFLDRKPQNIPVVFCLLFTMMVSYIIILSQARQDFEHGKIMEQNAVLESYQKGLELECEAIEEAEQKLMVLRHDLRHYASAVYVLLEQEEYGEAKKLIRELSGEIQEGKLKRYCENPTLNSVLCSLAAKAEDFGEKVQITAAVPREIALSTMELAAVTANLLENAINFVRNKEPEKRRVSLLLRYEQGLLIVETVNSCEEYEKPDIDLDGVIPDSGEKDGHGLGLKGVAAFVRKYGAQFDSYYGEGLFTIRILVDVREKVRG